MQSFVSGLFARRQSKTEDAAPPAPPLSRRGARATAEPLSYLSKVFEAIADPFDAKANPEGFVSLAVAENKLTYNSVLRPRLAAAYGQLAKELGGEEEGSGAGAEVSPFYGDSKGSEVARRAVTDFLMRKMLSQESREAHPLTWENLVMAPGCGALLEVLAWSLFDDGDACLIPAPYYPAFDNDLVVKGRVKIVQVSQETGDGWALREEALEDAFQRAKASGSPPKALLLTNPQNPLGTIYSRGELEMALRWARGHGLQIIADEIYACGTHDVPEEGPVFTSVAEVAISAHGTLGEDVHILYGMSKDFCLSGFRVGFLYSESPALQKALANLSIFMMMGTPTQQVVTMLFEDVKWTETLFKENRAALSAALHSVTAFCDRLGLPYTRPSAAMFILVDLRPLMPQDKPTWEDEAAFFEQLATELRVVATPGSACHCATPGFFRICYAGVAPEALAAGLSRIEERFANAPTPAPAPAPAN